MADDARREPPSTARVLAAARAEFARTGYERATVRAIAAAAGVDPALVVRSFGGKAALFARAASLEVRMPDVAGLAPRRVAEVLVDRFFGVWEDEGAFLALMRASTSSEVAVERMRQVFDEQVAPALVTVAVDRPLERAALLGTQVLGFAYSRYVVGTPVLAAMSREEVKDWLVPVVVLYLTDPALGRPVGQATANVAPAPIPVIHSGTGS